MSPLGTPTIRSTGIGFIQAPGWEGRPAFSVEVALALGGALAVELGGTLLAARTLLSLGCTPLALLCLLGMPFRGRRVFGGASALVCGLVTLFRRLHRVGLGLLVMSGDLAAKPLARNFAVAAPSLHRSSGNQQHDSDHDDSGNDDGNYGNR
jgi:hypothetical protein